MHMASTHKNYYTLLDYICRIKCKHNKSNSVINLVNFYIHKKVIYIYIVLFYSFLPALKS